MRAICKRIVEVNQALLEAKVMLLMRLSVMSMREIIHETRNLHSLLEEPFYAFALINPIHSSEWSTTARPFL